MTCQILLITFSCIVAYMSTIGAFRHLSALTPPQQARAIKVQWIAQPFAVVNFGVSKSSVALVVIRILGPNARVRRWTLYAIIGITMLLTVLGVLLMFLQCRPSRALWDSGVPATCWSGYVYWCWITANSSKSLSWKAEIPLTR